MADYEPLLRRAVAAVDSANEAARYDVYERARQALIHQMQTAGRSDVEMDREIEALEQAVGRIESEIAPGQTRPVPPRSVAAPEPEFDASPRPAPSFRLIGMALAGVVAAAVVAGAGVYVYGKRAAVPASRAAAPAQPSAAPVAAAPKGAVAMDARAEDQAPYMLRRQRIFYRTTHPPGTIVVSRSQHFLYVVQPNQVAIRYAIGVGPACDNVVGLFHVIEKVERAPDPNGQAGPRFGPPALYFDRGRAVHEATEPDRVGQSASVGCFQTWDQDIADLIGRIALNDRVVVAN